MYTVLLVIHTIVVLFLIGLVLIQRSDSDGMGLGGGSSGQFMSGRASANLMTRTTAILAAIFMISSLVLAMMVSSSPKRSVLDQLSEEPAAVTEPAEKAPAEKKADEKAAEEPAVPAEKKPAAAPAVPKPE